MPPGPKLQQRYGMGYDPNPRTLEMHQGAITPGQRVTIVDDVTARREVVEV